MKKVMYVCFLALTAVACKRDDEGPMLTQERTLTASFNEIALEGSADVQITNDTSYTIKVKCGANLLPYVITEVYGSTLRVYEKNNRIKERNGVMVYVSAKYIKGIHSKGSGNIYAENIEAEALQLDLDGSGNITVNANTTSTSANLEGSGNIRINGTAHGLYTKIEGSGNIDARTVNATSVYATLEGSGNIDCWVNERLEAYIKGSGNIAYRGDPPQVVTKITGSGNILKVQ